jgi:hypothetical protein
VRSLWGLWWLAVARLCMVVFVYLFLLFAACGGFCGLWWWCSFAVAVSALAFVSASAFVAVSVYDFVSASVAVFVYPSFSKMIIDT